MIRKPTLARNVSTDPFDLRACLQRCNMPVASGTGIISGVCSNFQKAPLLWIVLKGSFLVEKFRNQTRLGLQDHQQCRLQALRKK